MATSRELIKAEAERCCWRELSKDEVKRILNWIKDRPLRVAYRKGERILAIIFKINGDCQYGWLTDESGKMIHYADTRQAIFKELQK